MKRVSNKSIKALNDATDYFRKQEEYWKPIAAPYMELSEHTEETAIFGYFAAERAYHELLQLLVKEMNETNDEERFYRTYESICVIAHIAHRCADGANEQLMSLGSDMIVDVERIFNPPTQLEIDD